MRHLLVHRCDILRQTSTDVDGVAVFQWVIFKQGLPCRLDLVVAPDYSFLEAGRAPDRHGTLFVMPNSGLKTSDKIRMTLGPSGTFDIGSKIDDTWDSSSPHHTEIQVVESAPVTEPLTIT